MTDRPNLPEDDELDSILLTDEEIGEIFSDFTDDDIPVIGLWEEEVSHGSRPSGTFIAIAVSMILLFLVALVILVFFALSPQTVSPSDSYLGEKITFPDGWTPVTHSRSDNWWLCVNKDEQYRFCQGIVTD